MGTLRLLGLRLKGRKLFYSLTNYGPTKNHPSGWPLDDLLFYQKGGKLFKIVIVAILVPRDREECNAGDGGYCSGNC